MDNICVPTRICASPLIAEVSALFIVSLRRVLSLSMRVIVLPGK